MFVTASGGPLPNLDVHSRGVYPILHFLTALYLILPFLRFFIRNKLYSVFFRGLDTAGKCDKTLLSSNFDISSTGWHDADWNEDLGNLATQLRYVHTRK